MSSFLVKKNHMREALLFCFNLKKSAAESHRMLVDLSDKKRENQPRKVEDCQLQALLDEDDTQSSVKNACRAIGSSSYFHTATCHGEGSKDRKMGAA